jgi:hypothetical protein
MMQGLPHHNQTMMMNGPLSSSKKLTTRLNLTSANKIDNISLGGGSHQSSQHADALNSHRRSLKKSVAGSSMSGANYLQGSGFHS